MIILFIAKNGTKYVQFKFFGIFQLFLTVDILTDFDSLYQFISKWMHAKESLHYGTSVYYEGVINQFHHIFKTFDIVTFVSW